MSNFTIYDYAFIGMDNVNFTAFGLSFADETITLIDNSTPGQAVYAVADNPAVDQFVISYSAAPGGFIINDVVASRYGYLVFEAHGVGSFVDFYQASNNDLFSDIPLYGYDTFNGNSYNDVIDAGSGDDAVYGNGGNDIVFGGYGNDYLDGGLGFDILYGGFGDDVFVLDNPYDQFSDDGGTDTLIVTYNDAVLPDGPNWIEKLIFAGIGNFSGRGNALGNTIVSGTGKDALIGMGGSDMLAGRFGNDTLIGGEGNDAFVFDSNLGTARTDRKVNFDKVADFSVRDDSIWLDNAIFKKLGSGFATHPKMLKKSYFAVDSVKDANDYIIYNKKTGVLSYDVDGSGAKAAIEFALLKKGLSFTHKDIFVI